MFDRFIKIFMRSVKSKESDCQRKVKYLNDRIDNLTKSIGQAIMPIEITVESAGTTEPWRLIDCTVGDGAYETFTLGDWETLLIDIHKQIMDQCTWTTDIFDCDDFALVFAATMTYSAYKAGMKLQPAFGIAWSKLHAFNIFIADNKVYIYEPQNDRVMTLDEANKEDMYKVNKVWFMG